MGEASKTTPVYRRRSPKRGSRGHLAADPGKTVRGIEEVRAGQSEPVLY